MGVGRFDCETLLFLLLVFFFIVIGGLILTEAHLNQLAWPGREVGIFGFGRQDQVYHLRVCGVHYSFSLTAELLTIGVTERGLVFTRDGWRLEITTVIEFLF